MAHPIHVTEVEPLDGQRIRATFSDGAIKEIDLGELLAAGGVSKPIRDRREVLEQVRVNPDSRTVEWPGEVDLDRRFFTAATSPRPGTGSADGRFVGRSQASPSNWLRSGGSVGRGSNGAPN